MSDDKKNHIRAESFILLLQKNCFPTPLVGKWPLSASTRSQSHLGVSMIKPDLAQLRSEIVRHGKIKKSFDLRVVMQPARR